MRHRCAQKEATVPEVVGVAVVLLGQRSSS